jgi:SagB-type dehydrogenase family enzyme
MLISLYNEIAVTMKAISPLFAIIAAACIIGCIQLFYTATARQVTQGEILELPAPAHDSNFSLEQALSQRKSVREFKNEPLRLSDISQLLWAAQGMTGMDSHRTTPSAGALYPLEAYVVAGNVNGLQPGVYKYLPGDHALLKTADGDRRADLSRAAAGQQSVKDGAIAIVISGVYERTTEKYKEPIRDERTGSDYLSGIKYVHMEAGHASQNVYLQAASLRLGTVAIGALAEDEVRRILGMPGDERPLYIMPVGRV